MTTFEVLFMSSRRRVFLVVLGTPLSLYGKVNIFFPRLLPKVNFFLPAKRA